MAQTHIPPLSFPYPTERVAKPRPVGQGCSSCVHKHQCGGYYWYIRFHERVMPPEYGVACAKWSNKKEDIIKTKSEGDFYQIERWEIEGIAREANQNGEDAFNP